MKYKNVLYTAVISTLCLGITSCSDFLDEMPDNRTELTTEENITKVLVSTVTTLMKIVKHTAIFSG